jgi:outer membrane immunogenic protein
MKQPFLAATAMALIISAGSAFAADLPSRKEAPVYVPPPPPPMWTGFYVGLNAGGTFAESSGVNMTSTPGACNAIYPGCVASPNSSAVLAAVTNVSAPLGSSAGFIGGGQIGYNWQFSSQFVAGLEADIQGIAGSSGSATLPAGIKNPSFVDVVTATSQFSRSLNYIGTVRGRIGFLFTPALLVYGTGGLAYGGANVQGNIAAMDLNDSGLPFPYFSNGSFSDNLVGWTAGGGLEWMFAPHWSAKVEYLYYDLGCVNVPMSTLANFAAAPAVPGLFSSVLPNASTHFNGHIVRAGINYHFNWGAPAPVVAKY